MNALKHDLVQKVFGITGSTNMLAETIDAIDRATRDAHNANKWQRDVQYVSVHFGPEDGCPSKERQVILPNLFKRITEVMVKMPREAKPQPIKVAKSYSAHLNDSSTAKAVLLGNVLHVVATDVFNDLIIGGHSRPDVSDTGYNSWIAVDYPNVIIYNAAAQVLSDLGDASSVVNFQLGKSALDRMILSEELVT